MASVPSVRTSDAASRGFMLRVFGLEITRAKGIPTLQPVDDRGGWHRILESFTGAWQRNIEVNFDSVLSNHAVFACQTLIASDASKLRVLLKEQDDDRIWTETENPAYSPVLRKPNRFQTRIQFWESYFLSKLQRGNTYVLKERDARGVVVALYVLDPTRTKPLVAPDGEVYYELRRDDLSGLNDENIIVPAKEIIHDRYNCLFHPLVGISPIFANGLSATHGLNIQNNATKFFENRAMPSGILTAPGNITDETATRLKTHWEENYSGAKAGRVAVLGDGLKFERMAMTSVENQMIEQLRWTVEIICSTYHVPPHKIGIGPMPPYTNIQAVNVDYYTGCLQSYLEAAELCLDEGLGMDRHVGAEFDTSGLLRMDSVTQMDVLVKAVQGTIYSPDEARAEIDKKPTPGGASPMAQHQMYSLEALAKRDAKADPFATGQAPAKVVPTESVAENDNIAQEAASALVEIRKGLAHAAV